MAASLDFFCKIHHKMRSHLWRCRMEGKRLGGCHWPPFLLEHDRVFIFMPESSVWKLPRFIALTQPNVAFFASSNLHSDSINVDSQESCIKANFWLPDCINVISQHDRIKNMYVCIVYIYINIQRFWWSKTRPCPLSTTLPVPESHMGFPPHRVAPAREWRRWFGRQMTWDLMLWCLEKVATNLSQFFWSTLW